jgi:hypothetical protein
VSPAALSTKYVAGSLPPSGADVDPPDYKAVQPERSNLPLILGASVLAAVGFAWWMNRDQKRSGLGGSGAGQDFFDILSEAQALASKKQCVEARAKLAEWKKWRAAGGPDFAHEWMMRVRQA